MASHEAIGGLGTESDFGEDSDADARGVGVDTYGTDYKIDIR